MAMRRAAVLVGLLAAPAGAALGQAQTAFDGSVVECVTDQTFASLDGRQITRYAFYGDGAVVIDVELGAFSCEAGGMLGAFPFGERRAYSVACERTGLYADAGPFEISHSGEGDLAISVDGRRILGHDRVSYVFTVDGEARRGAFTTTSEIACDAERCVGRYDGVEPDGQTWRVDLNCVVRPMAGV